MAAIGGGRLQIGVQKTGQSVTVPDDYRAKLMFYFTNICSVIPELATASHRLRDYKNYILTVEQEEELLRFSLDLSPDVLEDKCIFKIENCDISKNEFYELTANQTRFLAVRSLIIAGQTRKVQKIMAYSELWMRNYYIIPIQTITDKHWELVVRRTQEEKKALAQYEAQYETNRARRTEQQPPRGHDRELQRQELARYKREKEDQERKRRERREIAEQDAQRQELTRLEAEKSARDAEKLRLEVEKLKLEVEAAKNRNTSSCGIM